MTTRTALSARAGLVDRAEHGPMVAGDLGRNAFALQDNLTGRSVEKGDCPQLRWRLLQKAVHPRNEHAYSCSDFGPDKTSVHRRYHFDHHQYSHHPHVGLMQFGSRRSCNVSFGTRNHTTTYCGACPLAGLLDSLEESEISASIRASFSSS